MRPPRDEAVIRSEGLAIPSAASRPWILAATIIGSSLAFIDGTVVNIALPALQNGFHATVSGVQWVVESYGLFLGALILVGGSLGDLFGRRLIFLLGVSTFALASIGCGLSANIDQLIIARSIQGVGAALLVPGSLAIISTSFDEKSRGRAIGTWSGFTAITTALGPVLGGWLVEHASWRWVFFINLPLAAAVLAISLRYVPESRSAAKGRIDWIGSLAVTLGLAGLVIAFIESVNFGWQNSLVLTCLIAGCAFLISFPFIEARAASPMVPLVLFASSSFSGANLLTLFLYAAMGIFFFLFPMNLIQVQGYSATAAGAAVLPLIVVIFFLSRWSGGLVARYGPRLPLIVGPLLAAAGFLLFAVPAIGGTYWQSFFPAMLVFGFGMAVTVAPLTTVVMNSAGQDRVGAASGINNAVARVAGVLAIAVLGVVMVNAFRYRLNDKLANLSIPSAVLQEIKAGETRLAGLQLPAAMDDDDATRSVRDAVKDAFIFGFRLIMLICAGLSAISALLAGLMIRSAGAANLTAPDIAVHQN
jgi:EmrB/QacA subfamily drug resistance transporter